MHDEEAFLAAIWDQPEDDDSRLIYADWLEERGDARAEYLRVEHEVRVRGARNDKRLRALRSQLSADWLRAVHDGLLGPDWAIVLQTASAELRPAELRQIAEGSGLGADELAQAVRSCPAELARGLRYWRAHELRQHLADLGHVTVEFRPANSRAG